MAIPQRVVSLLPSATETVCALGLADRLVGRSHAGDFPATVEALPVLTRPKLDPMTGSGQLDRQVSDLLKDALAVYDVDTEYLRNLKPDLVLTQDLCRVCAVSLSDVQAALADWSGPTELLSLQPNRLDDLWADIRRVAEALGEPARGQALVEHLQGRLRRLEERLSARARPKVGCIEWLDPIMDAGNWVPELVAAAGGRELLTNPGGQSGYLTWDRLRAADPDMLVMLPCGYDLPQTVANMPVLDGNEAWQDLRAVQAGEVYLTDGNQFFNRPGPRLIDSAELLAEIFHPEIVAPKHKGWGWQRYPL